MMSSNWTLSLSGQGALLTTHEEIMPRNQEYPSTLNNGSWTNVVEPSTTIETQDLQKIGKISRKSSRMSKDCILMIKSKKLPIKGKALGNLLIGSMGRNFLLPRQLSTMVNCACPQKFCRTCFIVLSIQLKTAKSTSKSSMKSITNL